MGDRVLGLAASDHLCRSFPQWDAGKLSRGLARLVSSFSIHEAAQRLQLGRYLRLGPGEEKTGGREKKRLLADAFEAVVGAIYLDAGFEAATVFLCRTLILPALAGDRQELDRADYKSALQELLQQTGVAPVEYRVRNEWGPDHQKTFEIEVWHGGQLLASSERNRSGRGGGGGGGGGAEQTAARAGAAGS